MAGDAGSSGANIWVAASDGDQARVQYLIEHDGLLPTSKDASGYTPLHAAVSYDHSNLLYVDEHTDAGVSLWESVRMRVKRST